MLPDVGMVQMHSKSVNVMTWACVDWLDPSLHGPVILVPMGLGAAAGSPYIVFVLTFCCLASCPASGGIYVDMSACLYNTLTAVI